MQKIILLLAFCLSSHLHALQKIKVAVTDFFSPIPKLDAPQLIQAAAEGDIARIRQILGQKVPAHLEQAAREAVCKAAYKGQAAVITELVGLGIDIEHTDFKGRTPLHLAAEQRNAEALSELLRLGADVKAKDKQGRTALHWVLFHNDMHNDDEIEDMVIALVKAGIEINEGENYKWSPLDNAALRKKPRAVLALLRLGFKPKLPESMCFMHFQELDELRAVVKTYNEAIAAYNQTEAVVIAEAFQSVMPTMKSKDISDIISAYFAEPLIPETTEKQATLDEEEKSTK